MMLAVDFTYPPTMVFENSYFKVNGNDGQFMTAGESLNLRKKFKPENYFTLRRD